MLTNVKVLPRRVAIAVVAGLLALAWVVGAAHGSTASAAQIDNAITGVHVEQGSTGPFGKLTVDVDWAVPDSAQGGDTFTMTLPDALSALNTDFDLKAPDGSVVAKATVVGQKVTFTLTNYANSHNNVHGTAFFSAGLNLSHVSGPGTVPLTFTTPGKNYTDSVTVTGSGVPGTASPRKSGQWVDASTQKSLKWSLYTSAGPFTGTTFKESVGAGQRFDCSSLSYIHASSVDSWGRLVGVTPLSSSKVHNVSCSSSSLQVTVGSAAKGEVIVVQYTTTVTDDSLSSYPNSATATTDGHARSVSASVARLAAGGNGSGNTHTTTTTTTKTTAPTTTTTAPTTTTTTKTTAPTTTTTAPTTTTTTTHTTTVSPTSTSRSPSTLPTVLPTKITASPSSPSVSPASLAFTGTDALPMVALGGLLLVAGAALNLSGRRHRKH